MFELTWRISMSIKWRIEIRCEFSVPICEGLTPVRASVALECILETQKKVNGRTHDGLACDIYTNDSETMTRPSLRILP